MGRPSKYSSTFKAKAALEALRGDVTHQELSQHYSLSPSKIGEWLGELETHTYQAFERSSVKDKELKKVQSENKRLLEKVDQLSIDCVFCECLRGIRTQSEIIEIEASRPASMSRKRFCAYMSLNRSTLYYKIQRWKPWEPRAYADDCSLLYLEQPTASVL